MANVNAAFGFRPARYLSGAPYNGAENVYSVPSSDGTALFIGDPVVLTGTSDADGNPECIRATVGTAVTTDRILGFVTGFVPDPTYTTKHRAASTARKVLVADDPTLLFEAQEDGNMGIAGTSSSCQIIAAAGNTYTGNSGFQIDSSESAQTATDQLLIIRPVEDPTNDPTSSNARWLVKINMHCYAFGVAGY